MPETIVEVSQYKGQKSLVINCTQLGDSFTPQYKTAKQKRAVLDEWCDFLRSEQEAFDELNFCTKMPQELFDAVCCQRNLKSLHIKWGSYESLDALANLSSLKSLFVGSGASVKSIAPIATLTGLESLAVENFQKINDYSALTNLQNLKSLEISGDGLSPKFIHIDSLSFYVSSLVILVVRIKSKDYSPILSLKSLTHLSLPPQHTLFGPFDEINALLNLKTRLLKESGNLLEA